MVNLAKKREQKAIKMLIRKNPERCSICKVYFEDYYSDLDHHAYYTCTGYDKKGKLQVTSQCCADKIGKIINIGLCGYFDPSEFEEILKQHPLYNELNKESVFSENLKKYGLSR